MEERTKVLREYFEVLLHLNSRANRIIQLDQA